MSDFNMLRFQECNDSFLGRLAKSKKWIVFWICAFALVFINLGLEEISGSEGRWFAVVREMLLTGDWLHPTINGQPYFDKPLVSYWFIAALASLVNRGDLNEFLARAPSAIFALFAMLALIRLARRLYGESVAWLSAWIFLTVYPFAYWGRRAEADMESLALILIAVEWYAANREKPISFFRYFVFWLICAIGAQTKGLPGIVVPACVVAVDVALRNDWRHCLNWKFLAALLCGILCYFLPFFAEAAANSNGYGADGLTLVFRENIVRAFNPWDHMDDPWYMYFPWLGRLLLPWTPFFVLAFVGCLARGWRESSLEDRWIFLSIVVVFVLFALSESRRVYYILPIIPFCVILTASQLERLPRRLTTLASLLFRIVDFAIPAALLLGIAAIPAYAAWIHGRIFPQDAVLPNWFSHLLFVMAPIAAFALFCVWIDSFVRQRKGLPPRCVVSAAHPELNRIVPVLFFSFLFVFAIALPLFRGSPEFSSGRPFFQACGKHFRTLDLPKGSIAFFGKNRSSAAMSYYLNLPEPMRLFSMEKIDERNRSFFDDTVVSGGIDDLRNFIEQAKRDGGVLIAEKRTVMNAPEDIQKEFDSVDVVAEPLDLMETKALREADAIGDAHEAASILKRKTLVRYYFPPKGNQE